MPELIQIVLTLWLLMAAIIVAAVGIYWVYDRIWVRRRLPRPPPSLRVISGGLE